MVTCKISHLPFFRCHQTRLPVAYYHTIITAETRQTNPDGSALRQAQRPKTKGSGTVRIFRNILLAQLGGVGEEIFLGFNVPEAAVGFAEAVEFGIDWVGLAFFPEIGDGGERHLYVGVDELLAAFD